MKNQKGVSLITLIITIIVVIILAVIALRSGASEVPDQAAFSKFAQQMGELQDAVKLAMLEAKSNEILKGNSRTESQLYNFIARGGYDGFAWEKDRDGDGTLENDIPNDAKWLTMADAENIKATIIYKNFAKESIGQDVPVIKVETAFGVEQEVSYFVTNKGTVFCWPPYMYDGKSYVNANTTIKEDTKFDTNGKLVLGTIEMGETDATNDEINGGDRIIVFSNEEIVRVLNANIYGDGGVTSFIAGPHKLEKGLKVTGVQDPYTIDTFVFYTIEDYFGRRVEGHYFFIYDNSK